MTAAGGAERLLSGMEGAVTDAGYDSYATAWRYLGAYKDCSGSSWWSRWWGGGRGRRRRTEGEEEGEEDGDESCGGTRYLLWAAYSNPYYSGEQIGEYQFYTGDGCWDSSTCTADSCLKMDCHDPYGSDWELTGVYKESMSFDNDNFFEQLFKHQGYCLWDGDKEDADSQDEDGWQSSNYQFMQAMRQELPEGCTKVDDFGDDTYYIDIEPQSYGDVTLGVYTDSSCSEQADYSFYDYQQYAASSLTATAYSGAFDTWNSNMDSYKICQPCRAYNLQQMYGSGSNDHRRGRRHLKEEDDGQGDEEQNGYNCYDDAGYQNCNQCYKFETHTDMQAASSSDLEAATAQGTILAIQYDGTWYGNGTVGDVQEQTYDAEEEEDGYQAVESYSFAGGASLLILGLALFGFRRAGRRRVALAAGGGTVELVG